MNWRKQWNQNRRWIQVILVASLFALIVRLLIKFELDTSALLYLAAPYFIALILAFFRRRERAATVFKKYANLTLDSLIVMLASSMILFEGFICVLMFMPIYFAVVLLAFIVEYITFKYFKKTKDKSLKAHIFPCLILLFSLEGVSPNLSFSRENIVSVEKIINASPLDIKNRLKKPMNLKVERHWFLSIFPMPYQIEAESLEPGDIHTVDYRYHKWFFTNTHEGSIKLLIDHVSEHRIETRIVEDQSYMSSYMDLKGTEILFTPQKNGTTKVKFSVYFNRKLDPAWYFQPLQEYGVRKMAELLIEELMTED